MIILENDFFVSQLASLHNTLPPPHSCRLCQENSFLLQLKKKKSLGSSYRRWWDRFLENELFKILSQEYLVNLAWWHSLVNPATLEDDKGVLWVRGLPEQQKEREDNQDSLVRPCYIKAKEKGLQRQLTGKSLFSICKHIQPLVPKIK